MINNAFWIAPEGAENFQPCHFLARKKFTLSRLPSALTLQIACDSLYLLEINRITVGRGPARGTGTISYYDEYDISGLLREGENCIEVMVLSMNCDIVEATLPVTPALRLAAGEVLSTDESWETFICTGEFPVNGPLFTRQSGYAEWRDMNFDWHIAGVEPSRTVKIPETSPLLAKKLLKRDIPLPLETVVLPAGVIAASMVPACDLTSTQFAQLNTHEERFPLPHGTEALLAKLGTAPVTLPLPENNGGISMVIDFAKEVSGRVEITLDAPAGSVADIVFEEELYENNRLRADHTHTNPTYQFCDRYILRQGRQTIGNLMVERGFRMVQLTLRNMTSPVTIHEVKAVDVRYPFVPRGQFFCSDYQLNRLWDTAKETISACTTDIFTDCPWRERLFYCNDMLIENRVAMKIFGNIALHQRAFRMIFSQKRPDGLFTSVSPSSFNDVPEEGKTDFRVILSGNLTLAMAMRDYYMHFMDKELVRECFPQLRKMLETFKSWKNEKGIITPPLKYWNFVDWSFELNGMEFNGKPSSLLNFLYIISCRALLFLAGEIGEEPVESESELQRILRNSIAEFYSEQDGFFLNSTMDAAADDGVLKALGVVPPAKGTPIGKSSRLAHALALQAGADPALCKGIDDKSLLTPELYYGIFLLDGYEILKDSCKALAYIREYWGEMLDTGTPTLWENGVHKKGKSGFGGSASLCHGFSSSPAAFLQSTILGIAPLSPGFARFKFIPECADLKFARGSVPTPFGSIRAAWQLIDGRISATLHVPQGCVAETPAGEAGAGDHILEW